MSKIFALLSSTALAAVPGGNVAAALSAAAAGLVRFVSSTVGMVTIAAALSYGFGHHVASKKCKAAAIAAQLEATKEDLTAAELAANIAEAQTADIEAEDQANSEKVNALSEALKSAKGRVVAVPGKDRVVYACGLSDGDARRLRDIK